MITLTSYCEEGKKTTKNKTATKQKQKHLTEWLTTQLIVKRFK